MDETPKQQEAIQRFWDAFQASVEEARVRPGISIFYVRWARAFVDFFPGKRLRERSREEIEGFLADLGMRPGIKEWRVAQARHALRILYEVFLPSYAPEKPKGVAKPEQPGSGESDGRAGAFRDSVVPGEVDRLYPPLVDRLKTEIRTRHYSIRTEQAYVEWMRRFVAFHGYANPANLTGMSIKEYLDFLAVERQVSANTQNQALNALVFFFDQVLTKPPRRDIVNKRTGLRNPGSLGSRCAGQPIAAN